MKDLHTQLTGEDLREDEGIYTIGDDIIESFVNGNFSQGCKELVEIGAGARDFNDYLMEQSEKYGIELKEMYYGHFDNDFFIALGSELRY